MNKYCKLICVTSDNRNKYYEMEWDGKSSTFNVKYGRVESTITNAVYNISKWDSKYNEKIKKGYKDVTSSFAEDDADTSTFNKIQDVTVDNFINKMVNYTKGLIKNTYSIKAKSVTKKQIENAQSFIDEILKTSKKDKDLINKLLIDLYTEIPRYMGNVRDHLLPNINIKDIIENEQDNLDALSSQVKFVNNSSSSNLNLLDHLGIKMKEIKPNCKDIDYIISQLSKNKIKSVFQVEKETHDNILKNWISKQKNKSTRFLIHGTKCSSVVPIIEQGLKIRPSGNYQFSGKAYGEGNYFSEVTSKSLNYTGWDSDQVLLIYEVHTGNPFKYNGWYRGNSFSLNYKELSSRGYDSTYVSAGNGLVNSEIIVYKEQQASLKYIIWLNR
jgi:poly [ADP-ribose] polymerase